MWIKNATPLMNGLNNKKGNKKNYFNIKKSTEIQKKSTKFTPIIKNLLQ